MLSMVTSSKPYAYNAFYALCTFNILVIANVWFAVALSRIDQSSWNMHHIKAEYFLFHIVYVIQLFLMTYDHFVKVRHKWCRLSRHQKHSKQSEIICQHAKYGMETFNVSGFPLTQEKKILWYFPNEFSKFHDNQFDLFPVWDNLWCCCREVRIVVSVERVKLKTLVCIVCTLVRTITQAGNGLPLQPSLPHHMPVWT